MINSVITIEGSSRKEVDISIYIKVKNSRR